MTDKATTDVAIDTSSALERRIDMTVALAEIEKDVAQRLKQMSRTVKMAGFRPGKVPMKMVAQQYGSQARSEAIGAAVEKAYGEKVREQNLRVAGYPRIEPKDGDGAHLAFSATFEIYPEFKLGDLGATKIERPALAVGDAEVDKTIEILRKQRVHYDEVTRPAQAGDRVTVDFIGRIDGEEFTGGKGTNAAMVLGEGRRPPDFESGLVGAAAGQSRTFPVRFPADYGAKDVAGKTASFEVIVNWRWSTSRRRWNLWIIQMTAQLDFLHCEPWRKPTAAWER